ncbi:MAG: hypothetical protein AAFP19_14385, partial [Bacteroidota bacterium]
LSAQPLKSVSPVVGLVMLSIFPSPLVDQRLSDNAIDFDGDTYPNHLDLDADNDGITDVRESGASDGNNDGLADDGSLAGTRTDSNGDGWEDNYDAGTISTTADGADANTSADQPRGWLLHYLPNH